jgi:hypothetical protein
MLKLRGIRLGSMLIATMLLITYRSGGPITLAKTNKFFWVELLPSLARVFTSKVAIEVPCGWSK